MSTASQHRGSDSKARAGCPHAASVPGAGRKPRTHYGVRAMRQVSRPSSVTPKRDRPAKILAPIMPEYWPLLLEASIPDSGGGRSPPLPAAPRAPPHRPPPLPQRPCRMPHARTQILAPI